MADFRKGDIVQNIYAGKGNPCRYLLYLGKGTCRQGRYTHKVYDCIGFDGHKVQVFRENDPLIAVGHMAEFDAFMAALKSLKDIDERREENERNLIPGSDKAIRAENKHGWREATK